MKALVGIAFSIGFIIGPMIGVIFSKISGEHKDTYWYTYPALFAFFLSLSDLIYVIYCLEETLSINQRAKSLACGISGAMIYINPVDLFQFNGVTGLDKNGKKIYYYFLIIIYSFIVYIINRIKMSKNTWAFLFFISICIQWTGIYIDIFNSSCIWFYKYGTRLYVFSHWIYNVNYTRWFCTTNT